MPTNYSKKFVLGKAKTYFSYRFTFPFSTDGSGIGVYVSPLSMWEYVKNGVRLVIRVLSTQIGVTPVKEKILHAKIVLETSLGLLSSYFKNLSFNRQIYTKIGILIISVVRNIVIKISLLTKTGIYTKGLWSSYNYSKTVVVNPSIDGALSSYTMKLTIHRTTGTDTTNNVYIGTDCSFDYSDIDFTTLTGTYLKHWVESYTDSEAVVWIKAIDIPASPTTTSIVFYYGSTLSSIHNSGENTFTFFDDFSAGTSKWTIDSGCSIVGEELIVQSTSTAAKTAYSNTSFGTNYALRTRLKSAHISGNYIEDASISDPIDGHGVGASYCSYYSAYNNTYYNQNIDGRSYLPVSGWSADTYHIQDIIRNSTTNSKFYVDNANLVTVTDTLDTDSHPIRFFTVNNTAKLTIDWVLIRPYTANEPTFGTWGSKVTAAGYPFKNYLLKLYRGLSTKVGLITTKYKGVGYNFGAIKVGLLSTLSQTIKFIRSLSSNIGVKSSFDSLRASFRFLNTAIGFAFTYAAGTVEVLATSIGLVTSEPQQFASYKFITSIGLVSSYIVNKGNIIFINTVIGIKSSITNIGLSIQELTSKFGLIAMNSNNVLAKALTSSVGLVAAYTSKLESYFSFIISTNLMPILDKQHFVVKEFNTTIGLIATEGFRNLWKAIEVSIGLTSTNAISIARFLTATLGLISTLSRQIDVKYILQTTIGITLVKASIAIFEEVLEISIGLISDIWYKAGGRVREMSISLGLTSSISNTVGFYREISYSLGLVATKVLNNNIIRKIAITIGLISSVSLNTIFSRILETTVGFQSILSRNITSFRTVSTAVGIYASKQVLLGVAFIAKVGLVSIRGIKKWASSLVTQIGFISIIDRHRHDYEVLATSIGLVTTKISTWFGPKRFKTLKFLNPATKDNKKLRIKK